MIRCDVSVEPRESLTPNWILLVVESIVAENASFGVIHGPDLGPPVDDTVRLVEIDGRGDIIGNDFVVLPQLWDTVHLDCKHYRHVNAVEFAREKDNCRATPALAEEHNASGGFLIVIQDAVSIGVEQVEDGPERSFAAPIFKHLDEGIFGRVPLKLMRDLHGSMVGIRVAHESANETDEDVGRWMEVGADSISFGGEERRGRRNKENQRRDNENPISV
jgi:hypothetical protein